MVELNDRKMKQRTQVLQLKDISKISLKSGEDRNAAGSKSRCVFEMVVAETVYMVGELAEDGAVSVESERAVCFEGAIRLALMPLIPEYNKCKKNAGGWVIWWVVVIGLFCGWLCALVGGGGYWVIWWTG